MKIYSKFKDYYDGIGWTLGEYPIFHRETTEIKHTFISGSKNLISNIKDFYQKIIRTQYKGLWFTINNYGFIQFCGQIYPFRNQEFDKTWGHWYSLDEVDYIFHPATEKDKVAFDLFKNNPYLFDNQKPIILYECSGIIYNPCLANYNFQKIVDPYTAATELDKWLSNVAYHPEIPSKVSDMVKIEARGFDKKISFRKEKTKNKTGKKK